MPGPGRSSVGNDVVDLGRPEARNKAEDERFIRRVLNAAELAWLRSAPDPDQVLWMIWAAKEAAFKIVQKQDGGAVFAHRSYEVLPSSETRGTVEVRGGSNRGASIHVEWNATDLRMHCLALSGSADLKSIRADVSEIDHPAAARPPVRWSDRELLSARSAESLEARLLAKRLASDAGLGSVEIVREPRARRLGPPVLYAAGEAAPLEGWDLSLSHDGVFAAAALCPV